MPLGRADSLKQEAALRELAQRVAGLQGLEVYDLVFRRSGPRWKLQVFLSRAQEAVTLEDCERVSRQLSRELDVADPIAHAYDLEVSSPGIERPLREAWHWERSVGQLAAVRWRDAEGRTQSGVLLVEGVDGDRVRLRASSGEITELDISAVLSARIHVEW